LWWKRGRISEWATWPIWKPGHIPYCLALDDITLTTWLAGEREWSKYTGERAVNGLEKRLGPEDPLTLNAMFNLARTYFHLGDEKKCHELLLWVLRRQKRYFGMKHPDTLMTRNELGMLLCASKRHLISAQRLVENVLQARRQILGEEHAYTLWSVNDLSKVYVELGRPAEAVAMLENIIPIVKRTLGEDHVGMSMTKSNLGKAYSRSGRFKEAEETVRPLLAGVRDGHPDWIQSRYGYARILFKLGRIEEAEKYCLAIMDRTTRAKTLRKNLSSNPTVVLTAKLLFSIYRHQGGCEDRMSALKRKFAGVDLEMDNDQPGLYRVSQAPNQSSQGRKSGRQTESKPDSNQSHIKSPSSSQPDLQQQGPFPKPSTRHTF
jgi:tetratricopeptide (TPR) repeat protein